MEFNVIWSETQGHHYHWAPLIPLYMIAVYTYSVCFLSLFELAAIPRHTYTLSFLGKAFNQQVCQGGWKEDRNSKRGKINFQKAYGNNRIFNQISLEIPSYFQNSLQGSCFMVQNEFQ